MRITLNKVAKQAGVSVAAISQVLNNHPNALTLRPETRERILQIVREMGYVRNENALQTRTGICKTVALISDFDTVLSHSCAGLILSGILFGASQEGYGVKVYDGRNLNAGFDEILRYGIANVLSFLFDIERNREIGDFCRRNDLRLCYIQNQGDEAFPMVYSDDRQSMADAARYLYDKGHRRFALVNALDELEWSRYRKLGFLDGMAECGVPETDYRLSCRRDFRDHVVDLEGFMRLPEHRRPTAFLCTSDNRATLVEMSAFRLGLRVPEECAIIGYADTCSELASVPISTITQPFREMGELAFKTVIGKPEPKLERRPNVYFLKTGFIERESTT